MKKLLDYNICFLPQDSKKNISVPFSVDEPCERLIIKMSYSPKIPNDEKYEIKLAEENIKRDASGEWGNEYNAKKFLPLKNLITLSLDCPQGYRGCAHRQDSNQIHFIGENDASAGFYAGKIQQGIWTAVLNIHALITNKCECNLIVECDGGDVL